MKKKFLNRVSAFLNISLLVFLLLPNFIAASAFAVDSVFPSTNEINKTNGWANVNVLSKEVGSTTFEFKSTRGFVSCFEYRTDGDTTQKTSDTNYNAGVTDGLYPYLCVNNTAKTQIINAKQYIEIRLAFGGEKDERFAWTRFDVMKTPPPAPVLESPINRVVINDNTPLMQWSDVTFSDGRTVAGYNYIYYYNCTSNVNPPSACASTYPINGIAMSERQAGRTDDGLGFWKVQTVDNEGNLSEWSKLGEFTVDTGIPTTTLVTPVGLAGMKFTVSGLAKDNISLNRVYVQLVNRQNSQRYGGTTIHLSGTEQSWSQEYDATEIGLPEGDYAAHVAVVDNAGNTSSVGWSEDFKLDATYPTFAITEPVNGSIVKGTQRINAVITDENDITKVLMNISGKSYSYVKDNPASSIKRDGDNFYVDFDTTTVSDGVTYVSIRATDGPGNTRYWNNNASLRQHSFTIDNTSPVVPTGLYFTAVDSNRIVACGGFSNTHHITEHWNPIVDDPTFSHYEYSSFDAPNGRSGLVEMVLYTNYFDSSWWTIPREGTYGFQVRSVDKVGNKSAWALGNTVGIENACTITIDWKAPVVQITSPLDNQYVKGTVDFRGTVSDENLLRYYYSIAGVVSETVYADTAFEDKTIYTWDTTKNSDGMYEMRLEARDKADNKSETDSYDIIKVTVDNTAPTGEIIGIRYPKADVLNFVTNDTSPLIYGTFGDNYEVDKVEVKVGDTIGDVVLDNDKWIAKFTNLMNRTHTISLKIKDKAGNTTEVTREITIDSIAPTATYTHYINGEIFEGDIAEVKSLNQLSFTASYTDADPSSGLKYDSFAIFQAQDDGTFRFSANGKKSYCGWRKAPNLVELSGLTYELTEQIAFTKCVETLPGGEYYMAHQVYDNAVRKDIPSIYQFRDVLGLHFIINNTPTVTISTPYTEVMQGSAPFTIEAKTVDGDAPLTYLWTGSNGMISVDPSFEFNPITPGVYTYTVKVTDKDGDYDEESITINVSATPTIIVPPVTETPEVLGATNTTTNITKPRTLLRSTVLGASTEVVETTAETRQDIAEVLGEEEVSCDVKKPISGYVYIDKNRNDLKDEEEKAFENIKIKITTKDKDGEEKIVEEFVTDVKGAWNTTLCTGKYYVTVDTTSIPKGYTLKGDSIVEINVLDDDSDGLEQQFILSENKTFIQKYWWIILLIILVLAGVMVSRSKKKSQY